jgi:putative methyltransferase (TIGR04325 family)
MDRYANSPQVMSVTGWTHPTVTPRDVGTAPYFDGRAECWVWGTWARVWRDMDVDARSLLRRCERSGVDPYHYGADLPEMAAQERRRNVWAVRFLCLHMLRRGLCLRPPYSLVEHIGWGSGATNAGEAVGWMNPPLKPCPPLPAVWPEPVEHPECPGLWQAACGGRPPGRVGAAPEGRDRVRSAGAVAAQATRHTKAVIRDLLPPAVLRLRWRMQARRRPAGAGAVQRDPGAAPEWEYVPEGWRYARHHPEVKGWNVPDILDVYKRKWDRFASMARGTGPLGFSHESDLATNDDPDSHNTVMSFAYVLASAARSRSRLSMLDWGGGIGHYYLLAKALLPGIAIEYHCKDVPVLAAHGARLFPDLHFYDDESCLNRRYDLVVASGALHYEEQWADRLARLSSAACGSLYVTRVPTVFGVSSYVFVQRPTPYGYNTEYLGWCLNRGEFLAAAASAALTLRREFVIAERPPIAGAPEPCRYRGYWFTTAEGTT